MSAVDLPGIFEPAAALPSMPRAPLFGIGEAVLDGRPVDIPIGWDDIAGDIRWAEDLLRSHGVGAGSVVVLASGADEVAWSHAFVRAAANLGANTGMAWSTGFDARRVGALCRRLQATHLIGATSATVAGLLELPGGLTGQVGSVTTFLARSEAHELLAENGVDALLFDLVGPALIAEWPERDGARFDEGAWSIEEHEGQLLLSTVRRTVRLHRADTGRRGAVLGAPGNRRVVPDGVERLPRL